MADGNNGAQLLPKCNHLTKKTLVDTSSLLLGLMFSSIGLGFFVYGRKQRVAMPLICGIALMVYPYFVSNNALLVAIGVALIAIPYFWRI